jgi:hypothetical protein
MLFTEIVAGYCENYTQHSVGKMHNFLAPFANLRKVTITFVMSVCPSVPMEQLGSHWKDFHEEQRVSADVYIG